MQSPAAQNYFEIFGLPRMLRVDESKLQREFYKLSRKLHPDTFAQASADEQQWSLELSSQLNDAYRTLKDPIARTEYLLKLEGVELEEQSRQATDAARAAGKEKQQVVPADLLEEAFELNMQLEEAKMDADDPQLRAELEKARVSFEARLNDAQMQLEKLWSEWDAAEQAGDDAGREKAKQGMIALLNRRSYIRNLVRDVREALGE
jgi:molecular chaperone HscB